MLEIIVNNKTLDLENESIKYTKVGNDISDLSSRETNYTDSFSIPKSENNINVLNGLGLKNDTSIIPYSKIPAQILDNGMPLLKDGWLEVKETSNDFKINIREGIIDLFKAIENKTFGDDVDLSEINHSKELATVVGSFTNNNYRYIINDYGGKTHIENNKINIDYLVPSVSVKYLWNKIFTTFGFNYLGNIFNTFDFEELWLTYPKGITELSATPTLNTKLFKSTNSNYVNPNLEASFDYYFEYSAPTGDVINNWAFAVTTSGSFKIDSSIIAVANYANGAGSVGIPPVIKIRVNGNDVYSYQSPYPNNTAFSFNVNLMQGDILNVFFDYTQTINIQGQIAYLNSFVFLEPSFLSISKYEGVNISFSEELKELKITDFFKEILNRFALTIFIDIDGNYVFKTFNERLQSGIVDWSKKYIQRDPETYTLKNYAQKNIFRQEYQDDRNDYNDGSFFITNKNLIDNKELIKSKIFSAEKETVSFKINSNDNDNEILYPTFLWEKEIAENNGNQEIKYKSLAKRFYFLRSQTINKNAVLKSESFLLHQNVSSFPIARFLNTSLKDFVPKYYSNIEILLNDFRFHKIKLALNTVDFINLDFDKIYYFEQEQNYYFLNKVSFQKGKISNAEFYRIKYSENSLINLTGTITNVTTNCVFFELSPNYQTSLGVLVEFDSGSGWQSAGLVYTSPLCTFNTTTPALFRLRNPFNSQIISDTYNFTP